MLISLPAYAALPMGIYEDMTRICCFIIALLCSCTLLAQAANEPRKDNDDRQELTRLVNDECEGVLENHAAVLDRIWADEFQMLTVDGTTTPKAQARAFLRASLPQSIAGLCEVHDLEIGIHGRKATTTGRMLLRTTTAEGTPVPIQFRFQQRLVKRDGRWQALRLEFSYIQP